MSQASRNWRIECAVFGFFILLATAARWQTFGNPVIGFDEQFYQLVGARMWHGALPYVDIFDRKPLGLFLIYAVAAVLGGGMLPYKLVALTCVAATAYLLYRISRPAHGLLAAVTSACLYIVWLNFMEGEGGQAEVFFNLPMLGAATLVWRAAMNRAAVIRSGAVVMTLVGIALQIKYTVVFEGIFFGIVLLGVQFRTVGRLVPLVVPAVLWIGCALAPTMLALAYYVHVGAFNAFVFANFLSMSGKHLVADWSGLAQIGAVLTPLAILVVSTMRKRDPDYAFIKLWLAVATLGVLAFGAYGSGHYGIPLLLPLCILTAPTFAATKAIRRRLAPAIVALFFGLGQIVLARVEYLKGGATAAAAVASAAKPSHGCIYVYDGYPALYELTHSCLPTRWAFPGHLSTRDEAYPRALGVDPVVEVQRILATRPDVIVDDAPTFSGGNPATHALIVQAEARDYRLVLRYRTGTDRFRLVYRHK